ncbi:MAG: potassium channel family protein [Leptolyngbyaceae cyanobacterium]
MPLKRLIQPVASKLLAFQRSDTKFVWILAALFLLILLNPVLSSVEFTNYFTNILLTLVVVSGILAASDERQVIRQLIFIGSITLSLDWIASLSPGDRPILSILVLGLYSIFMAIVTVAIILAIVQHKIVTLNTICGAISGYLMIGLTGAILGSLLEVAHPGMFLSGGEPLAQDDLLSAMLYYSLVTLSTIGYGDITPGLPLARSLSLALGLSGQIYLTVLVAMLVGKLLKD